MKTAYIGMSCDPPHEGHLKLIERVENLGFEPIIVLNSDSFIRKYKNREPFWNEDKRWGWFEFMGYEVEFVDKDRQRLTIEYHNPDVIVVGTDWMKPEILPQLGIDEDFLLANNIGMLFLTRTPGISSTELRNKDER